MERQWLPLMTVETAEELVRARRITRGALHLIDTQPRAYAELRDHSSDGNWGRDNIIAPAFVAKNNNVPPTDYQTLAPLLIARRIRRA